MAPSPPTAAPSHVDAGTVAPLHAPSPPPPKASPAPWRVIGGTARTTDGSALQAFISADGLARDDQGRLYLGDTRHHLIRRLDPDGTVTTLAGMGLAGNVDGPGDTARFSRPQTVALDGRGHLYVADTDNAAIRVVDLATHAVRTVVTKAEILARSTGEYFLPIVTGGPGGQVFMANKASGAKAPRLFRLETDGQATAVELMDQDKLGGAGDQGPLTCMCVDATGALTFVDGTYVRRMATNGTTSRVSVPGLDSSINGLAVDAQGRLLYSTNDGVIHRDGELLAGKKGLYDATDGPGADARFAAGVSDVLLDPQGRLIVADGFNHRLRRIDLADPTHPVTTLAGTGLQAFKDGPADRALFLEPHGVAVDAAGVLYVADAANHAVRKVLPDGTVSTLAGGKASGQDAGPSGTPHGQRDGPGTSASFIFPRQIAVDAMGKLYVTDAGACSVRTVQPDGTVATLAGRCDFRAGVDGDQPTDLRGPLAVRPDGALYQGYDHRIRTISAAGISAPFAGSGAYSTEGEDGSALTSTFAFTSALALGPDGMLYVADGAHVRKVSPTGQVGSLPGRFTEILALAVAPDGAVFFVDHAAGKWVLHKQTPGQVSTLVSDLGFAPSDMAWEPSGKLVLVDEWNARLVELQGSP